ncbi:hypothetical protein ILYODFUR_009111, partial [Ilyodon furcidens]
RTGQDPDLMTILDQDRNVDEPLNGELCLELSIHQNGPLDQFPKRDSSMEKQMKSQMVIRSHFDALRHGTKWLSSCGIPSWFL